MPLNEPRSASQKLQSSGDSLRSLSDPETLANFARNLQEGIYITNEGGEILDANSAFLETQLREQSIRDPLTGCFNRRQLQTFYERPTSDDERWGCVYADIDHFKQYNDEYGHAAGDSILIRMSRFLMRHVRAEEPVVRMGGDEFLIILSGADLEATERVVRRLQTAALDTAPVSFSLGWAARQGGERLEDTANRADRVLLDVRVVMRPGKNTRRAEAGEDTKVTRGPKRPVTRHPYLLAATR